MFYHLCYEGSVDLGAITDLNDRLAVEVQITEFGQVPKKLFQRPHPSRSKGGGVMTFLPSSSDPDSLSESDSSKLLKKGRLGSGGGGGGCYRFFIIIVFYVFFLTVNCLIYFIIHFLAIYLSIYLSYIIHCFF